LRKYVFSFEKSGRCDDNQQITVSHCGEHKRLHLKSSKQSYYIISFMSNNKSNLYKQAMSGLLLLASQFGLSRVFATQERLKDRKQESTGQIDYYVPWKLKKIVCWS